MPLFEKLRQAGVPVEMDKLEITTGVSAGATSSAASKQALEIMKTKVRSGIESAVSAFMNGGSDGMDQIGLTSEELRRQISDYATTDVGSGSRRGRKTRAATRGAQEGLIGQRADAIIFRALRAGTRVKLYGCIVLSDPSLGLTPTDKAQLCVLFASQTHIAVVIPSMNICTGDGWGEYVKEEMGMKPALDLDERMQNAEAQEKAEVEKAEAEAEENEQPALDSVDADTLAAITAEQDITAAQVKEEAKGKGDALKTSTTGNAATNLIGHKANNKKK